MKNYLVILSSLIVLCGYVQAETVQWPIADGGNGHYYIAVSAPEGITWTAANDAATLAGGYLATITSQEENEFVFGLIDDDLYWREAPSADIVGPWLGGYQPDGSQEPAGNWIWVTSDPFEYTSWETGEPNNSWFWSDEDENHLHYFSIQATRQPTWNDIYKDPTNTKWKVIAYIIEFEVNASVIYVDDSASGNNDGSSWIDAFIYLQDALSTASYGDEIRVAQGIYRPDKGSSIVQGDRTVSFSLKNGVTVRGGYAGVGAPYPNLRNKILYESILSGDLAENDLSVSDPADMASEPTRSENSYHVVWSQYTINTAVLEGFTITAGNANGDWRFGYAGGGGFCSWNGSPLVMDCLFTSNSGINSGGMRNAHSRTTVLNCTFTDNNSTGNAGGGMGNINCAEITVASSLFVGNTSITNGGGIRNKNSTVRVSNSIFHDNKALTTGGGMSVYDNCQIIVEGCTFSDNSASGNGGGMLNSNSSNSLLTNCMFIGNSSGRFGGGISNLSSHPELTDCTFSDNQAGASGGAVDNYKSRSIFTSCTFSENTAVYRGGGMLSTWGSNPTVTDCIFNRNTAEDGGGMENYENSNATLTNCTFSGNSAEGVGGGMSNINSSSPTVTNCIFWGNTAFSGNEIYNLESDPVVSYCDVKGGCVGIGNIDSDPLFVDPDDDNFTLFPNSPCIDAADNTSVPNDITDLDGDGDTDEIIPWDILGQPRFIDQPEVPDIGNGIAPIVDMGAIEANYVFAGLKMTPRTLNCRSKGNWVKAHFTLPEGYTLENVDPNQLAILHPLGIESDFMEIYANEEGMTEIVASFDRQAVCSLVGNWPDMFTVFAFSYNGSVFYGESGVRVITPRLKEIKTLAWNWLQAGCGPPHWCDGLDLNRDTTVNLRDYPLLLNSEVEFTAE